jgi:uncharacterized protein
MSREYPDWVNPWKAADGNRVYAGTIALRRMTRLAPLLASAEGTVAFEAEFTRDALGWATIRLDVEADLKLVCQASLEAYTEAVARSSVLVAVENPERQDELPDHYETAALEDGRLVFLESVQDELILAIPQVPRKPGLQAVRFTTDPQGELEAPGGTSAKPFAVLGELLGGAGRSKR